MPTLIEFKCNSNKIDLVKRNYNKIRDECQ